MWGISLVILNGKPALPCVQVIAIMAPLTKSKPLRPHYAGLFLVGRGRKHCCLSSPLPSTEGQAHIVAAEREGIDQGGADAPLPRHQWRAVQIAGGVGIL